MLRNTAFVIIMTTIGYLQFFAEPYIMTGGGPLNSTMSVVLHASTGLQIYNLGMLRDGDIPGLFSRSPRYRAEKA